MYTIVVAAAVSRLFGALTMYEQFVEHLKDNISGNKYYIFVHPSMPKPKIDGVEYIEIDIISTFKRLKFDYFGCAEYLKVHHINADVLISFENTGIRVNGIPQFVLYQQGLPFYPKRWNPFIKNERILFYKTYLYPFFVKFSLSQNCRVIVHAPYLKTLFSKKYSFDEEKIYTMLPDIEEIDIHKYKKYDFHNECYNFIYPAGASKYKEHITIVRALSILKGKNSDLLDKIRIHLTLKKEENNRLQELIIKENLSNNFVFHGFISREQLLAMYKSCTGLLFPSTIESVTLPLWEAVTFRKPVVCQDLDFGRYQLEGYAGVKFVEVGNYDKWCDAISEACFNNKDIPQFTPVKGNSWEDFFGWIDDILKDYKK